MAVKKIKKDIYWVGAIDWDRRLWFFNKISREIAEKHKNL